MDKKNTKLKDIKKITIYFLLIYIPTFFIILAFSNYFYDETLNKIKEPMISEQEKLTAIFSYNINTIYEDIYSDITFLKNSNEVQRHFTNLMDTDITENKQFYINFLNSHKLFTSIGFFDKEGIEATSITKDEDGNIQIINTGTRMNKSDQYYYDLLTEDGINIYLNSTDGDNELIYPTMNYSIPIVDANADLLGYIMLTYSGESFLNNINKFYMDRKTNIKVSLLSSDGCWFESKEESEKSVLVFTENIKDSFSKTYPDIWGNISNNSEGLIEDDQYIYYFQKTYWFESLDDQSFSWTVLTSLDKNQLLPFNDESLINVLNIRNNLFIISFISILVIVSLIYFRKRDIDNLNVLRIIADSKEEGVVITDKNLKIIYVNKAFEKITEYSANEVVGLKTTILKSNKQNKEFYQKMWQSISENEYWAGEIYNKKKSGILYSEYLTIHAIKSKSSKGKVDKYLAMFTDITEHKEKEKYIDFLKNYDQFTKLPNERMFISLLDESIENDAVFFAVIYIKLVNFDKILMNYGDVLGREITNKFILMIKKTIAKNDVIASITNEEFVLQLNEVNNKSDIVQILNELSFKFNQKIRVNNTEVILKLQCGVSIYPDDDVKVEEILKNAKIALNFVQDNFSFSYEFFNHNIRESLIKEIELEYLLENAINNHELEVFYQPQIDSITGKIVGAEALMRWNNSKYGSISPAIFIPIAEKSNHIINISSWLIDEVCKKINKLVELNLINYRISINISPIHFGRPDFADSITNKLKKNNCDITKIEIEITEGLFIENYAITNSTLQKLQSRGITVAIDDFGTGFSSLGYLQYLNIDKLKIDRTFIKDYPLNDNGAIAGVITNLAKELNLEVIAEGADSYQQIEYLQSVGCNLIQGFYYSKPLCFNDFIEFVKENR